MKFRFTAMGFAPLLLAITLSFPASAGVIFFANNSADFLVAMAGNSALGTEDFEGSTQGPNSTDGFDDPLSKGVANGFYPNGLSLPMTVQSNLSGGMPTNPNPRGSDGLAAASAPAFSFVSDVVLNNFGADSLDWIFSATDNIVGVGLDTISILAGTIDIRVFSTSNVLLGIQTVGANPTGTNFIGIQTTGGDFIGRINFSAASGNIGGGDNAQLFTTSPIPEPGTLALFGLGLAGLGFARRRKAA